MKTEKKMEKASILIEFILMETLKMYNMVINNVL